MKVIAISGGTLNGSNDSMAKEALMGAQEAGAEIEFIRLLDLNLKPCTGCVACVGSLMQGGNGDCVLKDDFDWLNEKVLNADAVIWVLPIFEKGVPGIFRDVQDRMCGPAHDTGINIVAGKIAEHTGKSGPDPRKLKPLVVSFIGIGGSDWNTRFAADVQLAAMSPMWRIVDNEVFAWAKSIIVQDENAAKCRQVGRNIAEAAKTPDKPPYHGDPGVCSVCHSRNFHIHANGVVECEVCGVKGKLELDGSKPVFTFDEEQLQHAHTDIPGKMKHMDDIRENEGQLAVDKKTDKYRERVQMYKDFIKASKPS